MTDAPTTLLVLAGGILINQLTNFAPTIRTAVATKLTNVFIQGVDDIGYELSQIPCIESIIGELKQKYPSITRVVVVDHSMGWITGKHAALAGLVDYLIALDPVGVPFVSRDMWPIINGVRQPGEFWKAAPTPFITQLYVADGPPIIERPVSHNPLVHLQEVFDAVVAACSPGVQP